MSNPQRHAARRAEIGGAVRDACQECLHKLARESAALSFACLATADGRVVAWSGSRSAGEAQRQAAMTSSLLALSESFAKEALRSTCSHSTISTPHGAIITVRVPSSSRAFVLSIGADASEVLAMTLRSALDTADKIALAIDASN